MRLNSQAGAKGSPVSSLKCDRPSHPDWGHLGVVRATSANNRWQGPAVLQEDRMLAPYQRNRPAKLGSINIQYKPQGYKGSALGQA